MRWIIGRGRGRDSVNGRNNGCSRRTRSGSEAFSVYSLLALDTARSHVKQSQAVVSGNSKLRGASLSSGVDASSSLPMMLRAGYTRDQNYLRDGEFLILRCHQKSVETRNIWSRYCCTFLCLRLFSAKEWYIIHHWLMVHCLLCKMEYSCRK